MLVPAPDPVALSAGMGRLSAAIKDHPAEVRTIHDAIVGSGFFFEDAGKMSMSSAILYYSNMVQTVCPVAQDPRVKTAIATLRGSGVAAALDSQDVKWIILCIAFCM